MTKNLNHPKYRPDIDGLRAIAVLAVVFYHAFPSSLSGGFAGVDVFFVISGFLISTIIFQNIDSGTFSIVDFYSRRIRRIFPALSLVLFSVLIVGWTFLFPNELKQLGQHTYSSAWFIQNFTLWKESGYFDNINDTKPLLHIWSLGIEEQFYFLWPLLLWGAGSLGGTRHKKSLFFLVTIFVFIISLAINIISIKTDPVKTFYLPQYRFWELATGGLLSWVVYYRKEVTSISPILQKILFSNEHIKKIFKETLAFLGLAILLTVFIKFNTATVFPGKNALLPVLATVLIIFYGPDSFLNRKILSNHYLVWFGLISFPLYLWHWPILSFGRIIYGEQTSIGFRFLAIAFAILLSWLTVVVIEKPFRFGNKNISLKITTLCLLIFTIGCLGYYVNSKIPEPALNKNQIETEKIISESAENCKKIYPKWVDIDGIGTDQWCRIQNENPSIALVGDSHSGQLYYGFIDKLKHTKERVANFPSSCAAPLLNISTAHTPLLPYRKNNARMMKMAFDYIGNKPSIHTVYLAHNPDCFFGSFGNAIDLENPNEKNKEVILKSGLLRTLNFLNSKKKNVVIILDNPSFPFLPGRCKSRGLFLDHFKNNCELDINSPSREIYNKIVQEIIFTQFPNVKVLNLATLFCKFDKCSPIQDGKLLYPDNDGGHLNNEGSVFVSDYLLKSIIN